MRIYATIPIRIDDNNPKKCDLMCPWYLASRCILFDVGIVERERDKMCFDYTSSTPPNYTTNNGG